MNLFRLAFHKLRLPLFILQWIGNLAAILLAFAWLQIPDSHTWEFLFSILSGIVLVLAFLALYGRATRMLAPHEDAAPRPLRLWAPLAAFAIGYFLFQAIDIGRSHEGLFAGYWNSRFPAGMRSFFSYPHFVQWQEAFYSFLKWIILGLLLPVAFLGTRFGLRSHAGRAYRRLSYWLVILIACFAGSYITGLLVDWAPGHGTATEILSVIARLGMAYTVDIFLLCFVLAMIAACREHGQPKAKAELM